MNMEDSSKQPTEQEVLEEIKAIHEYIDSIPVVIQSLRQGPREIKIVCEQIEPFHEQMKKEYGNESNAKINADWWGSEEKYIAIVRVEKSEKEQKSGKKVTLAKRPLNTQEINEIDRQLREEMGITGLTKETYEDLKKFRVTQK